MSWLSRNAKIDNDSSLRFSSLKLLNEVISKDFVGDDQFSVKYFVTIRQI